MQIPVRSTKKMLQPKNIIKKYYRSPACSFEYFYVAGYSRVKKLYRLRILDGTGYVTPRWLQNVLANAKEVSKLEGLINLY